MQNFVKMAPYSMLNTLTILLSATAALFTAGADATPLPSSNTGTKAKTCVNGPPATGSSPGSLPIADYSLVAPAGNLNWTSYTVKKSWWDEHYLSGPHVSLLNTFMLFLVKGMDVKAGRRSKKMGFKKVRGREKSELTSLKKNSTCPTPTTPIRTARSNASILATRRAISARVTFCGIVRY